MDAEFAYHELKKLALHEFPALVLSAEITYGSLDTVKSIRMFLIDESFLEVWLSDNKYSYHWQRTNGRIYRHDNAPHKKHRKMKTFPHHFHDGSEANVTESYLPRDMFDSVRAFLLFIEDKLHQE